MNKLLTFQSQVQAIKKDSTNPFFKSNYFDINSLLSEITPTMNELKCVILQPLQIRYAGDKTFNVLVTKIIDTEIESDDNVIAGSEIVLPDLQDPQKMGSAITYYRRYSLQTLLGLQAEDDDGNLASNKTTVVPNTTKLGTKEVILPKTDTKKSRIVELCKQLGFTGTTAKEYEIYVMGMATYILKPDNYDLIINKLEEKVNKLNK